MIVRGNQKEDERWPPSIQSSLIQIKLSELLLSHFQLGDNAFKQHENF
jgi:hypothetical protein